MAKRHHTVYLQSKHRTSGTPSRYTTSLPLTLQSDPNLEAFKLTLRNFTTYNNFYSVTTGADTVQMDGIRYVLPHGTYTYQRLARALREILPCEISWLQDQNKMVFSRAEQPMQLSFDSIATLLGFVPQVLYTGSVIASGVAMTPYEQTHIMVHLNNISPMPDARCPITCA